MAGHILFFVFSFAIWGQRILTGNRPKNSDGRPDQDCAELSLVEEHNHSFLYC